MSDIEEFASDVLERAKARSKVLKETLGKPDVTPDVEVDCDESFSLSENVDVIPTKPLSAIPQKLTMGSDSPSKASGISIPLGNINVQLSASPIRRTRLRALANTINNWDDDYTHHFTPQSRFNLNKPSSPQRKPANISSPKAIADTNDRVRIDVEPKTLFASLATSTPSCLPSVPVQSVIDKSIEQEAISSNDGEANISHDDSLTEQVSLEVIDDCETSKNSELSDSFTYFNAKSENEIKSDELQVNASNTEAGVTQKCVLDDSVITALEAQGYVHSPASSKLYFDYKNPEAKENKIGPYQLPGPKKPDSPVKRAASPVRPTPICSKTPSPVKNCSVVDNAPRIVNLVRKQFENVETVHEAKEKPIPTGVKVDADRSRISVAQKAALYESMTQSAPVKEVDPIELSVSERKKLFEQGQGPLLFTRPVPSSPTRASKPPTGRGPRPSMMPSIPLKDKLRMFEQGKGESSDSDIDEPEDVRRSRPMVVKPDLVPKSVPPPPPMPPRFSRSASPQRPIATPVLPTITDGFESSEEDNTLIESPKAPSPKKEVSFSVPRSPARGVSPSSGKRSMSPKACYPGTRDVKRIRVNDPKPGRIYPSLTDIETTETETDTDMDMGHHTKPFETELDDSMESETSIVSGSSLGTYIERKAIQNSPLRGAEIPRFRPSEDFNASLACRQIDAFIDEALEGQDYSMETMCETSPVATSSPVKTTCPTSSPINPLLSQNLVHTVSFYRRQQTLNTASPKVTLTPKRVLPPVESSPVHERTFSREDQLNDIVKKLEQEAQSQQRSMAQASKALSLCKATMEFSDSRENVECERILLISTNKHSALVNEIHRLKTEGILGRKAIHSPTKGDLAPSCKGTMTVHEIAIQLTREFLARAMKGETVYHFIALIKYRNHLDASSCVSLGNGINSSHLHAGVLYFPNTFTIPNLEPDFKVSVEVFVLETLREYLPHEAKYHIKKESKKMTPKKRGDSQSKFTHFQHSPAGPNAVQACKFKSIGTLSVDITTLQRSHWQFERVSSTGPLEGSVSMKIQCSAEGGVEERGFLTIFQDISGYGDWHRRWCKLTSSELSYWMYPEDETNEPLGRIALRHCVTSRVGPTPRDVCARANAFLLVTTRSPHPGDKDTLVTSCHEEYTAVRHLISADTREERDLWCRQFNRSLANLRAWDPHAHSPDDTLF